MDIKKNMSLKKSEFYHRKYASFPCIYTVITLFINILPPSKLFIDFYIHHMAQNESSFLMNLSFNHLKSVYINYMYECLFQIFYWRMEAEVL